MTYLGCHIFRVSEGTPDTTRGIHYSYSNSAYDIFSEFLLTDSHLLISYTYTADKEAYPHMYQIPLDCLLNSAALNGSFNCTFPTRPYPLYVPPPVVPPQYYIPPGSLVYQVSVINIDVVDFRGHPSVVIIGNYTQTNSATLIVQSDGTVIVYGCAELNGTLQIQLDKLAATTMVDVMKYQCFTGSFTSIELTDPNSGDPNGCHRTATATPVYSSTGLAISLDINFIGCDSSTDGAAPVNAGAIAGGIVGGIFGAVVIFVVLVIIIPSWRKKFLPAWVKGAKAKPLHKAAVTGSPRASAASSTHSL